MPDISAEGFTPEHISGEVESVTHTPGPWRAETEPNGTCIVWALRNGDDDKYVIGVVALRGGEADARLIAAAPDLLAALYEAREFIDGQIDVVDGNYGEPAPNRAMVLAQEIDAAIAKAEGR